MCSTPGLLLAPLVPSRFHPPTRAGGSGRMTTVESFW